MNLSDYILENHLADEEPSTISTRYILGVLGLDSVEDQLAALEPSVRPAASSLASKLRRALRSAEPAPVQNGYASQAAYGGGAQGARDSQNGDGASAHGSYDSQGQHGGGSLPAWARENAELIVYCKDHQGDHYFIPGSGRRKLAEITADEWLARARWLGQQAQGALKSAAKVRQFADLITEAGVTNLGEVIDQVM